VVQDDEWFGVQNFLASGLDVEQRLVTTKLAAQRPRHASLKHTSSTLTSRRNIRSFHSIHNVVDRGVLQAMLKELTGQVVHGDQLIIC